MKNRNMKSNLDEMQEAKLLEIEHNGCWLAFWGLVIAMIVQLFTTDAADLPRTLAGEWILFMALAVYLGEACLRNGIWDRRLKADRKTMRVACADGWLQLLSLQQSGKKRMDTDAFLRGFILSPTAHCQ